MRPASALNEERIYTMNKDENLNANLTGHMDYDKLIKQTELLSERYPQIEISYIGATILDRAIPVLSLGNPNASKSVMYLGGLSGGDCVTSALLFRFAADYFNFLQTGRRMYNVNLPYLFERRRIHIIPMLNCDGCTIRINGCGESLLKDRLLSMNNADPSFGSWQANARGVDLRYNFSAGFHNHKAESAAEGTDFGGRWGYGGTAPESEPETASLCNHLRISLGTSLLISFHMDNNALTYPYLENPETPIPRVRTVGRLLSRMSCTTPEKKTEAKGTVEDWFTNEFRRPAFSVGCRYPETENTLDDSVKIYAYLRETLFCAPLLV